MDTLIISTQNDPQHIKLLRASAAAYSAAKSGEIKITYFLLFLAVAYPITYIFIKDENAKLVLFGCSFLLAVMVQIFSVKFMSRTSRGAIFKEEFDTSLFNLPWKFTLKKPSDDEVSHYSQQYRGKEIKDWYSTNLSSSLPHNTAVAVLQHSNTSWDIELRKTYRRWLINFLVLYSILLLTVFVIKKADALTIFFVLFSVLSFYTHFISLIRGHSAAIERREAISKYLDEIIQNKKYIGTDELRDIQDEIYATRQEPSKVPNFFFRWYKKKLNDDAENYIDSVNKIYS